MKKVIPLERPALDFEAATYELNLLIPKYVESLEFLEKTRNFDEVICLVQNCAVYRRRLMFLLDFIKDWDQEICFEVSMNQSIQVELEILEDKYLMINEMKNEQDLKEIDLYPLKKSILSGMDEVLSCLGFDQDHEDRLLVCEMYLDLEKKKLEFSKMTL